MLPVNPRVTSNERVSSSQLTQLDSPFAPPRDEAHRPEYGNASNEASHADRRYIEPFEASLR